MEPNDDRELNELLHEWQAPAAPPTLHARVRAGRMSTGNGRASCVVPGFLGRRSLGEGGSRTVRWLLTGTIRVPVPVGLAVAALLGLWVYTSLPDPVPVRAPEPTVSLADFEPVPRLEPRIVGEER